MHAVAWSATSSELRWSFRVRQSDSGYQFDACLRDKVKLQRAHGGCSGDERR
jgi:hypothetical protein